MAEYVEYLVVMCYLLFSFLVFKDTGHGAAKELRETNRILGMMAGELEELKREIKNGKEGKR